MRKLEIQTKAVIIQRDMCGKSSLIIVIKHTAFPDAVPIANVISIKKKRTAKS